MYKVVIVGSAHPLRGGLAAYNERLAKEIQDAGHKVIVVTFSLQYPSFLFPGKTQYSDEPKPEGLHIEVKINSINPLSWIRVGLWLRKLKPEIILIKYWIPFIAPCMGTIARIAKGNKKSKIISILDNVIPHEKRIGDFWLTKYFVRSCDSFIAMSRSVLEDLKKFTNKPAAYCPHPLFDNFGIPVSKESAKSKLGLETGYNYLLFFGFIRAYKGLDLLLEAFADERLRRIPLKLIIAGEYYQDAGLYFELIKKYELKEHIVQFNKFIPDRDVADYFCAVDMVVQPYKSATQSGITQIAYHFDKPMLVTNIGGLPEIIPDGKVGYVVEPESLEIANAIWDFYENKRESTFVQNVAEEKKKYSWSAMYRKIVDLYEEINH